MAQGDEDLIKTYKSNIKIFWYDVIMAGIIGALFSSLLADWVDEEEKDYKKQLQQIYAAYPTKKMVKFASSRYKAA